MSASDYMIGYGSILSRHSRETYSGMTGPALKVALPGWRRAWSVRYRDEAATYLGLVEDARSILDVVLVPVDINPEMRHRERGYVWTPVERSSLGAADLPDGRFWIVVNTEHETADADHPVPQSYVDTCLIGAFETGGEGMLRAFIDGTDHWDQAWANDRERPVYPRLTPLGKDQREMIDDHLEAAGVLKYRR